MYFRRLLSTVSQLPTITTLFHYLFISTWCNKWAPTGLLAPNVSSSGNTLHFFSLLPAPPLPSRFVVLFPTKLCDCTPSPPYWHVCNKSRRKLSADYFHRFVFHRRDPAICLKLRLCQLSVSFFYVAARRRKKDAFCLLTTAICICSRPE